MRVDIKIDANIFLEGCFQLLPEIVNKLRNPAIILVVLLAVADEDIVFITRYEACHVQSFIVIKL